MADTKISPLAGAVAREVYRRMSAAGLTQKGLAIRAGLNPTYVRDLFMGRSQNPTAGNLHKLAVLWRRRHQGG